MAADIRGRLVQFRHLFSVIINLRGRGDGWLARRGATILAIRIAGIAGAGLPGSRYFRRYYMIRHDVDTISLL